jgi:hypothetical protein
MFVLPVLKLRRQLTCRQERRMNDVTLYRRETWTHYRITALLFSSLIAEIAETRVRWQGGIGDELMGRHFAGVGGLR